MVSLGSQVQLVLHPCYCIHTLPPRSRSLSPIPHPSIQDEILLNRMTVLGTL